MLVSDVVSVNDRDHVAVVAVSVMVDDSVF